MQIKRTTSFLLCGLALLTSLPAFCLGQSSSDENAAVVKFDFNLKRMRSNQMVKNAGVADMLENSGALPPGALGPLEINKVDRIYGGLQAPNNTSDLAALDPTQDLPINFFVRVEFADAAAANALIDAIEQGGTKHEINGKTYIGPPEGQMPNMRAHLVDDKTFEIGTEDYVMGSDRNVFSKAMVANWEKLSKNDAIRISIDVTGMQDVFNEGMDMARQQAPPEMLGMVEMGSNLAGLSLGIDIDSDTLLTLIAYGKDSEGAENIKDGLNGILALAKMQAQQGMAMLEEGQQAAAKQVMTALKAQSEGNAVMIKIPKPDGFEELIGGMLQGGGPGSGF